MRPDPSYNPAVESVEEGSDVGSFVILTPAPQKRIECRNQLLGLQRYLPFGALPYPIHETTDRLLLGVRVQRTLSGLTTNLALGQIKRKRQSKHRIDDRELCRLLMLSGPSCWGEGCQTMQAHAC